MAQFPALFPEKVFAEMRGYQKPDGSAPFWESLGRHFFKMDFDAADDLCGQGRKSFIAQLMPRHPLYTDFLTGEARAAIGRTHDDTVPARRLLEQEGLRYDGYIDIFDGGPVLQARVGELRASRDSQLATLVHGGCAAAPLALVSTTSLGAFRVIALPAEPRGDGLALPSGALAALGHAAGAAVRTMPLAAPR
jgi:arginine N-succinyltransferase